MNKKYVKADICFESFELSTDIAAGCTLLETNSAAYICPVVDAETGLTIFGSTAVCMSTPPGGNDSVCYDVPLGTMNVFAS